MCSCVSSSMFGFPTVIQNTGKNSMVSPLAKWLLFPPYLLWPAVTTKVLLNVRLLCIPFSNTLSSSPQLFISKTTLHLLHRLFLHFTRIVRLWKKSKLISWEMWISDAGSTSFYYLPPIDELGYAAKRKKKKSTQMGQRQETNNVPKSEIQVEDCFHNDKGNCLLNFQNELWLCILKILGCWKEKKSLFINIKKQ